MSFDKNNVVVKDEKMYNKYKNDLVNAVEVLNVKKKINAVNKGKVGCYKETINAPLGYIFYLTRQEGLLNDFSEIEKWVIINSPYNREPFLDDETTLIKKLVYIIRTLWGASDFNFLPVSLISNPVVNEEADITMEDCLLAKDRGHFMTVMKMFVTDKQVMDVSFWKKVYTKLKSTNDEKGDTPVDLAKFTNTKFSEVLVGGDEFTLEDIIPTEIYNKIWTQEESIQIRLETINTHKSEIKAINVQDNNWTDHNHALTELTHQLILHPLSEWNYSQLVVDELCSHNYVFKGEHTHFLSGRKSTSFSGYETEPLMLFVSSLYEKFGKGMYQFLAKPKDDNVYVDYLEKNKVTISDMKKWSSLFVNVAELTTKNGTNIWTKLHDVVHNHYDEWSEREGKVNNSFKKVTGSHMDTALFYMRMGHQIGIELNFKRGRRSQYLNTMTEFIEYIIEYIENDSIKYEVAITKAQSWQNREKEFFIPIMDRFVAMKKAAMSGVMSPKKLKDLKMRQLRSQFEGSKLPMTFDMYDRKRKGEYEIVSINLQSGDGLELCHYISESNGGQYTEENTFMGPALDNNYMNENNCEKNHLHKDGDFYTTFKSVVEQPKDLEKIQSWLNTKYFVKVITKG